MAQTRKAGQIIRRGENKWLVRVYIGEDTNGKRQYHSKIVKGKKKDADDELIDLLRQNSLGLLSDDRNQTLSEYLDIWLKNIAKQRLSYRTYKDYEDLLKRYVREPLGKVKLRDLKAVHIQKLYGEMQERGLSARIVRYTHAILSSALKKAVQLDILPRNVAQLVQLPKQTRKEMDVLTREEVRLFLETVKTERLAPLFSFALATGMRLQEYCALQWKDIDLEKGTATIQRALVWHRKGGGWHFGQPKTSTSRRTIPLPISIVEELKAHRKKLLGEILKPGALWQNNNLVFPSEVGSPLLPRNLFRVFKRTLRSAGIRESIRLYDLRHTTATLLLQAGINPKVVSERLGHSTITLTLDVYSHVLPTMQQDASEQLEAMIFTKSKAR
jgi:integrase